MPYTVWRSHYEWLHNLSTVIYFPGVLLLIHPFNSLFPGQPGKLAPERQTILDFAGARDNGWQWHQLDHMQIICTSLQTDNHSSTSPLSFHRPDALPAAQSTVSNHWRHLLSRLSGLNPTVQLVYMSEAGDITWVTSCMWSHSEQNSRWITGVVSAGRRPLPSPKPMVLWQWREIKSQMQTRKFHPHQTSFFRHPSTDSGQKRQCMLLPALQHHNLCKSKN